MVNSYVDNSSGQDQGGRGNLPKLSIPSPPSQEREADLSPLPQESAPKSLKVEILPFSLGSCFLVRGVVLDLRLAAKGLMSLFSPIGPRILNGPGNRASLHM